MPQTFSKIIPVTSSIRTSCVDYVHPWTDSCLQAICGLYLYCMFDSLRVYGTVYVVCISILLLSLYFYNFAIHYEL